MNCRAPFELVWVWGKSGGPAGTRWMVRASVWQCERHGQTRFRSHSERNVRGRIRAMHKEATDPFERLRILRVLQAFGVPNVVEK